MLSNKDDNLSLTISEGRQEFFLSKMVKRESEIPSLHFDTVKFRHGPKQEEKNSFQDQLLTTLKPKWQKKGTEQSFMQLFDILQSQGCAIFANLVSKTDFQSLIDGYTQAQHGTGNNTFMHSYVNFADHLEFVADQTYNDAFLHPLLIALIAYSMGGPIRITDLRGKNTDPISINAQDNMLHVDNTPFRNEYKTLLLWQKGVPEGPSGQNFTFIPGTHKGNRDIFFNAQGEPCSTERESLFVSNAAIDGLFEFQKTATGLAPTVIRTEYPEAPLTLAFPAGSLVHHRYRTEEGNARSCIITAFHLCDENPGSFAKDNDSNRAPAALVEFMLGYPTSNSSEIFLSLLGAEAERIETKIHEMKEGECATKMVDIAPMKLCDDELVRWRQSVVYAPSPATIKLKRGVSLSSRKIHNADSVLNELASAMMYDKHGLLQLILYEDGREEIRKLSRKRIGEMNHDQILNRLRPWLAIVEEKAFSESDLLDPIISQSFCNGLGALADQVVGRLSEQSALRLDVNYWMSLRRLVYDLAEAITRCERIETFVSTSLFIFWVTDELIQILEEKKFVAEAQSKGALFLRNYIATVLLLEKTFHSLREAGHANKDIESFHK